MATRESDQAGGAQPRRHGLGSDHPDRRQPRHLHEDRLRQPRGRRVQEHVVDLPRLQRVHEGQGPARRRTSSRAASAASAATTTPSARSTRRTWRTASRRRRSPSGSSTSARPPSTCSTTRSSRTTWCSSTSASRWSRRRTRRCSRRRSKTEAPHAEIHGYRTIADIMRAFNPFEGEIYKEALAVEPRHARDVLPDGGAARAPLDALSGRHRHGRDAAALHRLPRAADARASTSSSAPCR